MLLVSHQCLAIGESIMIIFTAWQVPKTTVQLSSCTVVLGVASYNAYRNSIIKNWGHQARFIVISALSAKIGGVQCFSLILAVRANDYKTSWVTPIFYYRIAICIIRSNFYRSWKKSTREFGATWNFHSSSVERVFMLGIVTQAADPYCSRLGWFPWMACLFRADNNTLLHSWNCCDVRRALQLLRDFRSCGLTATWYGDLTWYGDFKLQWATKVVETVTWIEC